MEWLSGLIVSIEKCNDNQTKLAIGNLDRNLTLLEYKPSKQPSNSKSVECYCFRNKSQWRKIINNLGISFMHSEYTPFNVHNKILNNPYDIA